MSTQPATSTDAAPPSAATVFAQLRAHGAPAAALGARLLGRGAYELEGEGSVVRLSDGRELLDLGSYGVMLFGHRHPVIVDAVAAQLVRMPASTRLLASSVQAAFQAELIAALGAPYEHVWLGSSGADAVEAALKLARRRAERPGIIAVQGGYHGKSLGALGVTSNPLLREGFGEVAGHHVIHVDPADAGAVARAVAGGQIAALLVEPILGEGGVRPIDPDVLARWSEDARAAGALVIADEVQTGSGRCDGLSLARAAGLTPDVILLGKALGGGVMPLSAVVATAEAFAPLRRDAALHTLTFGGHPLACAAGRAALELTERLAPDHARLSAAFARELPLRAAAYPQLVEEVRGRGLLWGIELRSPAIAGEFLLALAEHGVLAAPCLSAPTVLRLFIPLTLTPQQTATALGALDASLSAVAGAAEEPAA